MSARVATYTRAARLHGRRVTNLALRQSRLHGALSAMPGCVVVAAYGDVGEAWHLGRPGLARLLADGGARRFEVLVVEDLGQLASDPGQLRGLCEQLAAAGVVVRPLAGGARRRSALAWAAVAFVELLGDSVAGQRSAAPPGPTPSHRPPRPTARHGAPARVVPTALLQQLLHAWGSAVVADPSGPDRGTGGGRRK